MPEDTHTVYSSLTAKEPLAAWQLRHTTRPQDWYTFRILWQFWCKMALKWMQHDCQRLYTHHRGFFCIKWFIIKIQLFLVPNWVWSTHPFLKYYMGSWRSSFAKFTQSRWIFEIFSVSRKNLGTDRLNLLFLLSCFKHRIPSVGIKLRWYRAYLEFRICSTFEPS